MLGRHIVASQFAPQLQFGPPSVARMTNVRPLSAESLLTRLRSVAAVGVPPTAGTDVYVRNAFETGPGLPAGESPSWSGITSMPAAQPSSEPGKMVAPKRA